MSEPASRVCALLHLRMLTLAIPHLGSRRALVGRASALLLMSLDVGATNAASEQPTLRTPIEQDCVMEAQQLVKLATPAIGVVARLDVDRGDTVHKGEVLGKLEDGLEEAALKLARLKASNEFVIKAAQTRLELLRRKYLRTEQLVAKNAASAVAAEEANSDANVAEQQLKETELNSEMAKAEALHAEELLLQKSLRSPIDGIVVERVLNPGEYRNDQSPILTLAQIDPLRVEVFVPTREYGRIKKGDRAVVRPQSPINGEYEAVVTVVDQVLDAASGTFGVRLSLPNPAHILPAGVRCKVVFEAAGTLKASEK